MLTLCLLRNQPSWAQAAASEQLPVACGFLVGSIFEACAVRSHFFRTRPLRRAPCGWWPSLHSPVPLASGMRPGG